MAPFCDPSDLCSELSGSTETEFRRVYGGDPASRILLSHGSLRVLADLSPLVEGHLLILPVQHDLSFAQFTAAHPDELSFLGSLLLPVYRRIYGDVTYLEHGSSSDMRGAACINHAHLHVLPLRTADVVTAMRADGLEEVELDHLADLAQWAGEDLPYYLVSDTTYASVFGIGRHMSKQYLRSVAARLIGLEAGTWDWAAYIRHDLFRKTMATMATALSS